MTMTAEELQQLCSSCPVVEMTCCLSHSAPRTAFLPLLQLSALTSLELKFLGAAAAAAVEVVTQLTELEQLTLQVLPQLTDPVMLQLTALRALQKLQLKGDQDYYDDPEIHNKVGCV